MRSLLSGVNFRVKIDILAVCMTLENPQTTLNSLYAIRTAMLTALANPQAEIQKYTLDGRSVEMRSMEEFERITRLIAAYEMIVVSATPFLSDFSQPATPNLTESLLES